MHFHMRCSDGTAAEGPFRIGAFGTLGGVASSAYANDRYIAEGTQGRDRSGYEESELAVADPVVELGVLFQQHDRQGDEGRLRGSDQREGDQADGATPSTERRSL